MLRGKIKLKKTNPSILAPTPVSQTLLPHPGHSVLGLLPLPGICVVAVNAQVDY